MQQRLRFIQMNRDQALLQIVGGLDIRNGIASLPMHGDLSVAGNNSTGLSTAGFNRFQLVEFGAGSNVTSPHNIYSSLPMQ